MLEIKRDGNQITVMPTHDIVASKAAQFREQLRALIQESPEEIIIDLSHVKMLDSVGIGVIIATYNALNKADKKLTIINTSPEIYHLFKIMHLDRHFSISAIRSEPGGAA